MIEQNGIPLAAVIVESIDGLFMMTLAIRAIVRYRQKQSKVTLYLMFGLFLYAFAALISGITKYIDFVSNVGRDVVSYSTLGILVAYCMMSLANVFFALLLTELFLKDKNQFPFFISIASFIIIGLIIPHIAPVDGAYDEITFYLFFFILVTMLLHGSLARRAFSESRNSQSKLTSMGFKLIAGFSILVIATLVFFITDLVYGQITNGGYTIFYYIGWITVGLATLCGFLGYIMPAWFRNMIQPTTI